MEFKDLRRKFDNLSVTAKAAMVYTLAGLATRGLSIITVPIFTRIMTTAEIGVINIYHSWSSMLATVITLALTSGGFLVAMKEYESERKEYMSSVLTITALMSILVLLIYLLNMDFWNGILGLPTPLVLLMIMGFLVEPARDFFLSAQRYELKYKTAVKISLGTAVGATLSSVVFVLLARHYEMKQIAHIRLFANYAVVYTIAGILFLNIFAKGRTFYNREYWLFSLKLSIPLIGNSFAAQVLNVSDRTMIGKMVGESEVGIYGTLSNVSALSLIVWYSINSSFIPYLFENMDNTRGRKQVRDSANYMLMLYAAIALTMTVVAPEIVGILAPKEYYEAVYLMPPIAAGIFLTAMSNMHSNVLLFYKKTQYIMISSIVAAVLNVVLNFIMIPRYGYQAAAYTTLFSYVILALIQVVVGTLTERTQRGEFVPFIYDTKFLLLISGGLIVLSLACIPLYQTVVLRYGITCIGLGLCLKQRRKFIERMKMIKKR